MLVYLMGYMGSGKSTWGKRLALELGLSFIDTDTQIEETENLSIPQIFESYGEAYFRKAEGRILKEISKNKNFVVATGGGLPCNSSNLDIIESTGLSIYLNTDADTILARLSKNKSSRPIISDLNEADLASKINLQLKERESFYEQAQINFKTQQSTFETLVQDIKKHFKI